MSDPILRGTVSGGVLITWPDGYSMEMSGPGWAVSALLETIRTRDLEVAVDEAVGRRLRFEVPKS
jgi:hypothetical protein